MRLVILCGHPESVYARRILEGLVARGRTGIHVLAAEAPDSRRTPRTLWKEHGARLPLALGAAVLRKLVRGLAGRTSPAPSLREVCEAQGGAYLRVPALNSEVCREVLTALRPDLVLLGGAPIVRDTILAIPRLGTLNAHQGRLPHYRGMNVLEWTILDGGRPCLTVHFVDPGVDTGDVIAVEPVPILPGDSVDRLKERAASQQVDLLCRTVAMAEAGPLPRTPQAQEAGRQYFVLHPQLRELAEVRLRRITAAQQAGRSGAVSASRARRPAASAAASRPAA